jgi:precorrin-2 methylase
MAGLQITYICLGDRLFLSTGVKLLLELAYRHVNASCFQDIGICDDER